MSSITRGPSVTLYAVTDGPGVHFKRGHLSRGGAIYHEGGPSVTTGGHPSRVTDGPGGPSVTLYAVTDGPGGPF